MSKAIEYCNNVFDGTHDSPKPALTGHRLITSKNIMNGYIDFSDSYFISNEDYEKIQKRSKVQKWDILISMIGTVGNVCLIQEDNIDYAIKNMGVFSCGDEYKAKWLYFYLQSPYCRKLNENYLNGAIQKFLPLGYLRELDIPDFDDNKRKIVNFLWNIETKIRNNNNLNQNLESLAKTLYDYWFLQFDFPNEEGKPYKSSGGKMVWNEELKREIPEEWEVKTIKEIEPNIITGKTPSTKDNANFGTEMPFITIEDIRGNAFIVDSNRKLSRKGAETQKGKTLPPESLCISCIASVGEIGFTTTFSQTNQQINSIVFEKDWNKEFMFFCLNNYFNHAKTKTGNTFANMNKEEFSGIKAIYDENTVKNFHSKMQDVFKMIRNLSLQNQQLSSLRDWLFPMLMNGQMTFENENISS